MKYVVYVRDLGLFPLNWTEYSFFETQQEADEFVQARMFIEFDRDSLIRLWKVEKRKARGMADWLVKERQLKL